MDSISRRLSFESTTFSPFGRARLSHSLFLLFEGEGECAEIPEE
jgi:hypothetical protein